MALLIFVLLTCVMPIALIYLTHRTVNTVLAPRVNRKNILSFLILDMISVLSLLELYRYFDAVNSYWERYLSGMVMVTIPLILLTIALSIYSHWHKQSYTV